MAHIKTLGAARFADLSMALIPGGATSAPSFSDMEKIVSAIKTVPGNSGLLTTQNGDLLTAMSGIVGATGLFQSLETNLNGAYDNGDAGKFVRITHVKEFPAMGTPANIVKVPVYGKKNSLQIQGQADSPTMELTLNYVPALWANGNVHCGSDNSPQACFPKVADGYVYLFRFTLLDRQPEGYQAVKNIAGDGDGSIADDIASGVSAVENTSYYFLGKIEALEVTPSLTDAITAKLTIAVQSEIYGAFTVD